MKLKIDSNSLIACIYEGGAEKALLDILIDNDCLIFNREQLIDNDFIARTSVRDFENNYLKRDYERKITILRVIDSRREEFNLKEVYKCQVKEIINVVTSPEIEMIIIANENKFNQYSTSLMKPSIFCKSILGYKNVKTYDFVLNYFSDYQKLIESIKKYSSFHKQLKNELSLLDILK